jgi:hypothetical protein
LSRYAGGGGETATGWESGGTLSTIEKRPPPPKYVDAPLEHFMRCVCVA